MPRGNRTAQNHGRSCASFCCSPGRTLPHCPRVSRIFCTARPESDGSFPHNSGIDTAPHVTAVRHRWDIVSDKLRLKASFLFYFFLSCNLRFPLSTLPDAAASMPRKNVFMRFLPAFPGFFWRALYTGSPRYDFRSLPGMSHHFRRW